jgi:hypothetical protein
LTNLYETGYEYHASNTAAPKSSKNSLSNPLILLVLKLDALNRMYSHSNHKTENGQWVGKWKYFMLHTLLL